MTFLQPAMLLALPVALLPVIIHLLNRLRYRSVKWAAVMFLIAATRSSTRRARLRHYLILFCRCMIILLFLLALGRPIVGGWLGTTLAGAPDTIIVLLDRSASMEHVDPRFQSSKRARALGFFAEAGAACGSSRFVLIENVLLTPQEIAGPDALEALQLTRATDTAADMPAMLRAAYDYMVANRTGRTEIWIASDLQTSNWRPQSVEWETLTAQMAALSQGVYVRLMAFSEATGNNVSLFLNAVQRRELGGGSSINIALELQSLSPPEEALPLVMVLDGVRSQVTVPMGSQSLHHNQTLELAEGSARAGWGMVALPADENMRDNRGYFVYGECVQLNGVTLCDDAEVARYLELAADPVAGLQQGERLLTSPDQVASLDLQAVALVAWQCGAPVGAATNRLHTFVEGGGTVICFPPARRDAAGIFGLKWGPIEAATEAKPYRVSTWEENQGALANTDSGMSLPVSELAILRRQLPQAEGASAAEWYPVASYIDGTPFLSRRSIGRGVVYACTTLPREDWSSLGDGYVLVPMIQRMLESGGVRLARARTAICGAWRGADDGAVWVCADAQDQKDIRWQAGVYRAGAKWLALNRPQREDEPEVLERAEAELLFGEVPVSTLLDPTRLDGERLQSEIWRLFVYFALLCMIMESGLLLGTLRPRQRDSAPVAKRGGHAL
jgi:hypothetical protein